MKKHTLLLICAIIFSCKLKDGSNSVSMPAPKSVDGKEIFENKGNCSACHQPDQKIVGPSLKQIATTYKAKNGDIVQFLKGNADPIVDPSQFEVMKTNFAITKSMSDAELQALEKYIFSFK